MTRNPFAEATRAASNPCSHSQLVRESAPRFFPTTRCATPSSLRRVSHVVNISCRAALPTRIGGFDQISSKRRSGSTSSGRQAWTRSPTLRALALRVVKSMARSLTSTATMWEPGQARAAAEIEERAVGWWRSY